MRKKIIIGAVVMVGAIIAYVGWRAKPKPMWSGDRAEIRERIRQLMQLREGSV